MNRRPQTGFLDDADATALAGARETEATPATQSPSPGQGVPGVGSALEAAAAAPDPTGFDILGMKLGMSVAEIEAAIKAYDPSLKVSMTKVSAALYEANNNAGTTGSLQFVAANRSRPQGTENISVGFTVTQPSRAFYILHVTEFPAGQQPFTGKTLQRLREIRSGIKGPRYQPLVGIR